MNRRRLAVAVAVLVALGLAGSIAYAAIPDAAGTIHGCYANNNGSLRVVDPANPSTSPASPTRPCSTGARSVLPERRGRPARPARRVRLGPPARTAETARPERREPPGRTVRPERRERLARTVRAEQSALPGPTGASGATGPAGSLDTTQIVSQPVDVPPHVVSPAVHQDAICPTGMIAVSGGYFISNLDPNAPPGALISWRPSQDRWQVFFYNPSTTVTVSAQTIAYCASSS